MKFLFNFVLLCATAIFLSACKTVTYNQEPVSIGDLYNFQKVLVKGGDFWITTYQKITDPDQPYAFYIEGDGAAFNGRYRVSHNPTPRKQVFIKLAAMDQRPNVVYVARPCQYTPMHLNPKCTNQYWTDKRLSDDSVQAINDVINSINKNNAKFSLVGYSGGGGIAILVAARNSRVKDIITVAGNLDLLAFTTHHNVTPMIGSLNPIDYAEQVKYIPQLHLSGGKDKIVPPFIADKFVQKASSTCVKQKIFEEASHAEGWKRVWEYVYTKPIRCY
ncbi:MAG: alpha/beta hydrolase [Rickettsiaceae bacterium]